MSWIFYAILAYALVGIANIIDKLLLEKYIKDSSIIVIFTGVIALFIGLIILLIRGFPILPVNHLVIILLSGIFMELYLLPYFKALELEDASKIISLTQLVPVFTLLLSFIFLKERLTNQQYIGSLLIIVSAFFLYIDKKWALFKLSKSFYYMVLACLSFVVSTILLKFVILPENFWDALAIQNLGIGLGTLMIALYPKYGSRFLGFAHKLPRGGWLALVSAEVFYVANQFLIIFAIALGSVALVNVLGGFQPVFVFIYGLLITKFFPGLLQENVKKEVLKRKLIALGYIFVGLYLIYI